MTHKSNGAGSRPEAGRPLLHVNLCFLNIMLFDFIFRLVVFFLDNDGDDDEVTLAVSCGYHSNMDTELFMECEEEELEPWQQVDDSVEEDEMDFDSYCEPGETLTQTHTDTHRPVM